jgi:energy-coupling factor transporter ATP-binding protein EcfA2
MSDERLDMLETSVAEPAAEYGAVRINRIKLSNYRFFHGDFELPVNGANILIYGENGSGKSTIYKALEYLTGKRFNLIAAEKNIFAEEGIPQIEFGFSTDKELIIDSDLALLPDGFDFVKGLSVFVPMLDYKKLLKIHYTSVSADRINVYNMLRELFSGYEVENGLVLADIKEPSKYFAALTQIVNKVLLDGANKILALFDHDITIENFTFKTEFTTDNRLEPVINIEVNYRDQQIDNYHTFLNEARLTALAVSLYFAAIKAMLGTLKDDCLKMLVLDDLLISLDMSNRLKLLDVLQAEFSDFQTFFFTHDKELFEIYKKLLLWEKFEFYVDDIAPVPAAKVVKSASELERAKKYYAEKEYDSCALQLRKGCENLLKSYLAPEERLNRNGEELDFSGMLDRAKSKNNDLKTLLERLDSDRSYILNRLCHDDHGQIYSGELRNAISALETLEGLLK